MTKLHEKGVPVKAPTLAKYLNEFRRTKEKKTEGKTDTPPPTPTEKPVVAPKSDRLAAHGSGRFAVTPDTSLEDL